MNAIKRTEGIEEKTLRQYLSFAALFKMLTGHDARAEEERAHRTLTAQFPDMVVAKAEYGDAINVTREIYRLEAAPFIHRLLDEIEARFPGTGDLHPDIAA